MIIIIEDDIVATVSGQDVVICVNPFNNPQNTNTKQDQKTDGSKNDAQA